MKRRLWVCGWCAAATLVASVLGAVPAAIWTGSDRLANLGVFLFFVAFAACVAMGFWSDAAAPERNLPRADRKRLREEERRKRLEAEVARLDEELGLNR